MMMMMMIMMMIMMMMGDARSNNIIAKEFVEATGNGNLLFSKFRDSAHVYVRSCCCWSKCGSV